MGEKIFSTNIQDYVAFGKVNAVISIGGIESVFKFHIPIVKEDDGYYYSLCTELNEVSYGSNVNRSFDRIYEKIKIIVDYAIAEEEHLAGIYDERDEMEEYKRIYDELVKSHHKKEQTDLNEAKKIDEFIKGERIKEFKKIQIDKHVPIIGNKVSSIASIHYDKSLAQINMPVASL